MVRFTGHGGCLDSSHCGETRNLYGTLEHGEILVATTVFRDEG
jgi:hypothetical protein